MFDLWTKPGTEPSHNPGVSFVFGFKVLQQEAMLSFAKCPLRSFALSLKVNLGGWFISQAHFNWSSQSLEVRLVWVCLHHIWAGAVLAEKGYRENVQVESLLPDKGEAGWRLRLRIRLRSGDGIAFLRLV